MELWHNPRCTKSRQAKALLDDAGVTYEERRYLDDPPTYAELDAALVALGLEPWEITRMKEPLARELGLKDEAHDRAEWIATLVANPILIERPIVLDGGRGAVGRPTEAIAELLGLPAD